MRNVLRRAVVSASLIAFVATIGWARLSKAATWHIEVVDSAGAGKFSSMKIDTEGNIHLAYVLETGLLLKYAFWDHKTKHWFNMALAENVGTCSLALDSKQRPHISYTDAGSASGSKLRHAYWDGASWKIEAIPLNSDIISYYQSIVIDAQDYPSITFYEYRGPKDTEISIRLRNVMWNGKYWEARTVDPEQGSGKFNSMAIDSRGHIHLAYANVSEGSVRYAYWDGKIWTREILESHQQAKAYVGFSVCVAVDKEGNPHVSYMDETTPAVKYAVRRNNRWQIQTLDTVSAVGYPDRNSIALDDQGLPYIGYYDAGRGVLKLAHAEAGKWLVETLDGNGAGFTSSLGIDRGSIWIGYADQGSGGFKVARRDIGPQVGTSAATEPNQNGQQNR